MSNTGVSALSGIRVLDLTDERGIYGVKLLADLGAEVIRPEPMGGDALRSRGPFVRGDSADASQLSENPTSLWYAYFASSRRFVALDLERPDDLVALQTLVDHADIVITCEEAFAVKEARLDSVLEMRPELIVIDVSSFGDAGPWKNFLAPDLVAGALGGAVATTGDADTPPLKSFGELNFMVSGVYAAIAALSAWLNRSATGLGQRADVSVHDSIASCLEHVLMWHWYQDQLPSAQSLVLPRQGSLHWSNAYKVMNANQGSIMVTPAPDFEKQMFWLVEEDAHQDLIDPKYMELENRPLMIRRMMAVLGEWVATKDAEALFFTAQERHAPYGWVLPVEKLAENPQLQARNWWVEYQIGASQVKGPGAPYRLSDTPWRLNPESEAGASSPQRLAVEDLLNKTGWAIPRAPGATSGVTSKRRPLEGIRVLDFTHVLAGPFATRVLADMGADVVKVNSAERAQASNDPSHPYYLMWNRSKRALALNMSDPEARPIARSLALQADVVIDNFSVGVLDRWGIGYDSVSQENPGVVYAQMSGMGEGGPWSKFVTYAPTIHALCGLTQLTGVPGREDIGVGFSYNDHQAGLHGAVAVLAALAAREHTGRGQRVDLSQFETGVNFLGPAILDWFANGCAARPCGNDLPYDAAAPHGVYPCLSEGLRADQWWGPGASQNVATEKQRWVAIACMTDQQWSALVGLLGRPDWSVGEEFATAAGRVAARGVIDAHLGAWTGTQSAESVMALCQAAGVPAGVVQTGADLIEQDPMLAAARFFETIEDPYPGVGKTFADHLPIHFHATPCEQYQRVRAVGEDNLAVLADWLGMSSDEVIAAEKDGRLS